MSERINLIDTIAKNDMFSTFTRMLRTSKANELLSGEGSFTVFVPTNDAFGKVPDAQMNAWLSETDQIRLKSLLSYHIVPGKLFAANLAGVGTAKSVSGEEITFTDASGIKVNASGMQGRNIEASNGIVHALDTVLTAPAMTATATAAAATSAATPTPAAVPTAVAPAAPVVQREIAPAAPAVANSIPVTATAPAAAPAVVTALEADAAASTLS
jgi:transforming growth factor-beta-induced protein